VSRATLLLVLVASCRCQRERPSATHRESAAEVIAAPGTLVDASDRRNLELRPEEGTLSIERVEATVGNVATAHLTVTSRPGYHIATKFPTSVTVVAPDGVRIDKTKLIAGDRAGSGDAEALSEQALGFALKAIVDQPGTYAITGLLRFGVCQDDTSCHEKRQPITIAVVAK